MKLLLVLESGINEKPVREEFAKQNELNKERQQKI